MLLGNYIYENGQRKTEKQPKMYICTNALVSNITKKVYYMEFKHVKDVNLCSCT